MTGMGSQWKQLRVMPEPDLSLLDNPVWHAISGPQKDLAECSGTAGRYRPEVSPFGGVADATGMASLVDVLSPGETVLLAGVESAPAPNFDHLELLMSVPVHQMLCVQPVHRAPDSQSEVATDLVQLGSADSDAMVALATLTEPGPFVHETHRLGRYYGIFDDGELVAMAGERFTMPGFVEVSGVCTHPTARGKGYASLLVHHLVQKSHERGEWSFLHVRIGSPSETSAVGVYARLGFSHHQKMTVHVVRRRP